MVIQFSRAGISWFATQRLVEEPDADAWHTRVAALVARAKQALSTGPTLSPLDLADPEVQRTIDQRVHEHGTPIEKAALIVLQAANEVRRHVPEDLGDRNAASAGYFFAQARSLLTFEQEFGDVTFAGHESNAQFVRALQFWNSSREADESTWQSFLTERPWLGAGNAEVDRVGLEIGSRRIDRIGPGVIYVRCGPGAVCLPEVEPVEGDHG